LSSIEYFDKGNYLHCRTVSHRISPKLTNQAARLSCQIAAAGVSSNASLCINWMYIQLVIILISHRYSLIFNWSEKVAVRHCQLRYMSVACKL